MAYFTPFRFHIELKKKYSYWLQSLRLWLIYGTMAPSCGWMSGGGGVGGGVVVMNVMGLFFLLHFNFM